MKEPLKLACIMAHPDDETLGTGGLLARYAAEGIETYLLTATRGEQGWMGDPTENPGPQALGQLREQELYQAGKILGLSSIRLLSYPDGQLDRANPLEVINEIASYLREVRPQVVVTFDPNGAYGHPDHIAISQFTQAAAVQAAFSSFRDPHGLLPHQVSKLYYFVNTDEELEIYQEAFGKLVMIIDGMERMAKGWEGWAITTTVDTADYRASVWQAVDQYCSQIPNYQALKNLPESKRARLWKKQCFYRAYSLVNGGREVEDDLFAGLREDMEPGRNLTASAQTF